MEETKDTRIYFGVKACPMKTFVEFDNECKENYGDCRWMYIQHLMEVERLYSVLLGKIDDIEYRLESLENPEVDKDVDTQEEPRRGLGSLIER
jgi:hypothetical protein